MRSICTYCCCLLVTGALLVGAQKAAAPIGSFESATDVSTVLHPGSVEYDASKRSYTVSGSGENMWAAADAFRFVWKKVSGDVTLAADISFAGQGGNAHKKAVLIIRQSLEADSAYADAALHGNGLASLQSRDEKGAATHEIQSSISTPKRLSIAKQGEYFYMWVSGGAEPLHFAGGSARIPMKEPFYIGIGVCAHDKDVVEKAVFSNVELAVAPAAEKAQPATLYSTLETITVASTDRRVVYVVPDRIEAPNWTHDGLALVFNGGGRILRVPVTGGQAQIVDTGFAVHCNSAHGISPDGSFLAISGESRFGSAIYIVPAGGGEPRRVTQKAPSYWHGWSPDGNALVFSAGRNIFSIPAAGGKEMRLTTAGRFNDNPEYSPDGQHIYFNSDRTGAMQIWRMRPDGTGQEQVTSDDVPNWYPHLSPDGRQMAFLSYQKGVKGRPTDKDVTLRIMSLTDKKIRVLAKLVGGPGTIDAPCWSPDSRRLAFVSYQWIQSETDRNR